MKIAIQRPSKKEQLTFADAQQKLAFNYSEQGNAVKDDFPPGYDHDRNEREIGQGQSVFVACKKAIQSYEHFPSAWAFACPESDNPPHAGQNVSVIFFQLGLWWFNGSRVIDVLDEPNYYGFSYGTLSSHVEKGEELFYVRIDEKGKVFYGIKAYSWPSFWGARLFKPYARWQQRRFVADSIETMKRIASTHAE